jgi:hypothetical protein
MLARGFRSFDGAWRTIQGYEVVHMIRKGQGRWLAKGDVFGQIQFIREILGLKSKSSIPEDLASGSTHRQNHICNTSDFGEVSSLKGGLPSAVRRSHIRGRVRDHSRLHRTRLRMAGVTSAFCRVRGSPLERSPNASALQQRHTRPYGEPSDAAPNGRAGAAGVPTGRLPSDMRSRPSGGSH